ncbi:PAS domain S-box protein [Mariprofundus erugo]|uniref:PAS domain S-box protein n=1 Tax=Mariprofundus erugo TaxID=2528639 RepID=UPI0010FDAA2B|nr:PAS domain S-box protein [Mariprofundus erugo]TLS76179.1 PAS domain S-box protein [Mariprofundus erugo]
MLYRRCRGSAAISRMIAGLIGSLFLWVAGVVIAEEAQSSYVGRTITVGSELDYPPYAMVDQDGHAIGYSVDLIRAVAREVGLKLIFQVGPWSEVKGKLERGEIDALPLVAYSVERDKYFDFSRPHIISHAVAFIRKQDKQRFHSLEDLRAKEVIVMNGDSSHEYVRFSQLTNKITLTDTIADAFRLLADGQHDFVIAPKLSGLILLQQMGIANIEPLGQPLEAYGKGYAFAVHEGNSDLLAELNRGLVLVQASGEYDRIYDRWFGHIDPRQTKYAALIEKTLIVTAILVVIILFAVLWNVSLRRQVRAQVKDLELLGSKYQDLYDNAPDMFASVDAATACVLTCNQTLLDKLGYTKAEVVGQPVFQLYDERCLEDVHRVFEGFISCGEVVNQQLQVKCKDGRLIEVMLNASAIRDEHGHIISSRSSWRDITDLKRAEQERETFFALLPDLACIATTDGYFRKLNDTWQRILGYEAGELCRRPYIEFVHPDDREATLNASSSLANGVRIFQFVNRYRCKNGSYRWLEWVSVPASDGLVYAVARDITERRELYLQLVQQRNQAQRYLDVAGVMLVALNPDGCVKLMNRRGLEMLGFDESELLGQDWFTHCVPASSRELVRDVFKRLMSGEDGALKYHENEVMTRSGELRMFAFHHELLMDHNGQVTGMISSGEDITERKRAESRLKTLSQAIEQAGEGVMITDSMGVIEYVNPAFCRISGYSEAEAVGHSANLLESGEHDPSFYKAMWTELGEGKVWQGRVLNRTHDGGVYPVLLTISPIRGDEGQLTHYVGVQQSLKEYEDMENRFHQAQKMEAIGTLVGGIAHDFNNSLAGIISNLYLIKQKSTDPDIVGKIENVESLSFSAAAMIQQLLSFSRKAVVNMNTLQVAPFLKEIIKLHRVSIPENILLEHAIEESGVKIRGDINQLQQVLMNLINNARDAVEGVASPRITVTMARQSLPIAGAATEDVVATDDYVCITVMDNGCGIDRAYLDHIFEPFFTTKPAGKGTGLGLAMAYGCIKTHGGWIFAEPGEGGHGTAMKIYLPLVDLDEEPAIQSHRDAVVEGQGETILLVDDNEMVLEVTRELLEGLHYRVLTAMDGTQAIEVYNRHQGEIDLLLLDVVMPNMGGAEVLTLIRQSNPDVKALFATGYNKGGTVMVGNGLQGERILSKPISIAVLSHEIRDLLEK